MSEPSPQSPAGATLEPGSMVGGRFRVEERIAAGGMGVVYRATQQPLGRPVALKVLRKPQDPRLDETYSQRFLREAAVVANLNHPNTVVVHDYGRDGDLLYFAMEFVDGKTLSDYVRGKGILTPDECVHVAKQIASSLQDAHAATLVHRDLKPGNIMLLTRGGDPLFTKVLDFGLVKVAAPDAKDKKLTQSGILMGSPRYMAPEQVRGTEVDHRTDIYSYGALLCFMLTGQSPFSAGSQFEAMRAHVYTPAPRLSELAPGCTASGALQDLVEKCLQKEPAARFQSMVEVVEALDSLGDEARVSAAGPPPPKARDEVSGNTMSAFVAQAIINPGASKLAWSIRIMTGACVVGLGVGLAVFIPRNQPTATPLEPSPDVIVAVQPVDDPLAAPGEDDPEALANPDALADPVTDPGVAPRDIVVRVEPVRAVVRLEGAVLGTGDADVRLLVPAGETRTLDISAHGYVSQTIEVDGSDDTVVVELSRQAREPDDSSMRQGGTQMSPTTEMANTGMEDPGSPSQDRGAIQDPWAR